MRYQVRAADGSIVNTIDANADFMAKFFSPGTYEEVPDVLSMRADDSGPKIRRITRRAFWNRFPPAKEAALRAVRLGAPAGALMLVGMLDRLNSRVDASPYVNLDDEQAIEGVRWLASDQAPETVPLDGQQYALRLTHEEADAILLPDPVGAEVYGG